MNAYIVSLYPYHARMEPKYRMVIAAETIERAKSLAYEQLRLTSDAGLPMLVEVGGDEQLSLFGGAT